jgi:cyclophilin family peptidyl-prolyl cis-trans isomerase
MTPWYAATMDCSRLIQVVVVACAAILSGCASQGSATGSDVVRVVMTTTAGDITLELDAKRAPVTVNNFMGHAGRGHYNETVFHRVIPNFVVQGGGWTPNLSERAKADASAGHPDRPIINEWQNGLKNVKGTIAMARDKDPDSATREFFINVADNAKLDTPREVSGGAGYAVFGRVVDGWDVVEKIRTGATGPRPDIKVDDGSMNDVPVDLVVIKTVRVVR